MTVKEKLNSLEELLEMEKDTLKEDQRLDELSQWDSMSVIALVAMFDDLFGKVISPEEIKKFETIKDIVEKME